MSFHLNLFTAKTLKLALQHGGLSQARCFSFTSVGSWAVTQQQLLLRAGQNYSLLKRRLDWILRRVDSINYPGETIAQWLKMSEEVIGTGG